MTTDEVIDLLTFMASYDRRTVGEADVKAWYLAIGDLSFGDAMGAVAKHYGRDSTDWMMPKHVRDGVKAIRAERVARSVIPAPSPDLTDDPRAYQRALTEGIKRAADGLAPPAERAALPAAAGPELVREGRPPVSLRAALTDFRRRYGTARSRRGHAEQEAQQSGEAAAS